MSRGRFTVRKTVYKLRFEGEQYDGLEVTANSMPLGEFLNLQALQAEAQKADASAAAEIMDRLAGVLVDWNLEDEDGQPIPCTPDGLKSLEFEFALKIMQAWQQAVASVPNLSSPALNGGASSQALSIPMEPS